MKTPNYENLLVETVAKNEILSTACALRVIAGDDSKRINILRLGKTMERYKLNPAQEVGKISEILGLKVEADQWEIIHAKALTLDKVITVIGRAKDIYLHGRVDNTYKGVEVLSAEISAQIAIEENIPEELRSELNLAKARELILYTLSNTTNADRKDSAIDVIY